MADPTVAINRDFKAYAGFGKAKLVASEPLVAGGFVGQLFGSGELQFLADEPGAWPVGYVTTPEFGTSLTGTALDTEADVGASFRGEVVVKDVTVTGVNGYDDIGEPVYMTDGQTFTLTRPSDDAVPVGFVFDKSRASTTTTCDVFVLGKVLSWILSCAGGNKRRIKIATVELADIADTNKFSETLWGHGRITEFGAQPWKPATTASKTTILTGAINGNAITTGAVTLTTAGLATAGTAQKVNPTALNEFHDGDVFTATAGTTTAFVEGSALIYIDVEYLPGA